MAVVEVYLTYSEAPETPLTGFLYIRRIAADHNRSSWIWLDAKLGAQEDLRPFACPGEPLS